MPASFYEKDFEAHTSFMRLNYYPRCQDPSQHLGISPHRDAGFLTVLAQHDIAGLQVAIPSGRAILPVCCILTTSTDTLSCTFIDVESCRPPPIPLTPFPTALQPVPDRLLLPSMAHSSLT